MNQLNMFALQSPQAHASRPLSKTEEFPKAPCDIPCVDKWPPFRLTPAVMIAYKAAEDEGMIHISSVQISKSTASAVVHYNSAVPLDWIHQRLKEAMNCDV